MILSGKTSSAASATSLALRIARYPWNNGQAERINRTVENDKIKTFPYDNLHRREARILALVAAYKFTKHLKVLPWRTLYPAVCSPDQKLLDLQHQPAPADFRGRTPGIASRDPAWSTGG